MPPVADQHATRDGWTVDELARRPAAGPHHPRVPDHGLLPPPRRSGRVGLYDTSHLRRLQLIARLQERGYSLAGIGDLLSAWRDGAALGDVLGLEPDQLVHVDEPGAPATLAQLTELLPALVPGRLDDLVATGIVEACGPDRYCVPSPSLLQLAIDALAAGLDPGTVLSLLAQSAAAADTAAEAVLDAFARIPRGADDATVDALVARGRGLLAHGVGRLTLHRLGRTVGARRRHPRPDRRTLRRRRRSTSRRGDRVTARANPEQFDAWNGDSGQRWVATPIAATPSSPPSPTLLLAPRHNPAGEKPCSTSAAAAAPQSLAAAAATGPDGAVVGLDMSEPMLDVARHRAVAAGLPHLHFNQGDAQMHRLEQTFDVAISRFGTMFFADPIAAFANIARHLRPGGRLCIDDLAATGGQRVADRPGAALLRYGALPEADGPGTPGMFAQADPVTVRSVLADAGFVGIDSTPRRVPMLHSGPPSTSPSSTSPTPGPVAPCSRPSPRPARRRARRCRGRCSATKRRHGRDPRRRRVDHHRRHPLTAARPVRIYDHRAEPDSEALTSEDAVRLYTTPVHCSPVCSPWSRSSGSWLGIYDHLAGALRWG